MKSKSINLLGIISIVVISIAAISCKKCKECKECELDPVTGNIDQNCSSYEEYCGNDLENIEKLDIYHCR